MTAREHVILAIRSLLDDTSPLTDEVELDAIGLDSLGRVEMAVALEDRLGVTVPDGAEDTWRTVGDVVAWAERAQEGRPL